MTEAARPHDEMQRLQTLRDYDVMNSATEEPFERLVQLTARAFDVPIAMISLVDEHRQWAKACVGIERTGNPRSISFCSYAILSSDVMTVLDMTNDERFCDHPLVLGEPHIRFYAGAPLIAGNGAKLGTLCLLDNQPHVDFSARDATILSDLAVAVVDALELRRVNARLKQTEALLREEQDLLNETFAALEEGVVVQDSSGQIVSANASAALILGLSMDQLLGRTSFDPRWRAMHEDGKPFAGEDHPVSVALREGVPVSDVLMGVHHPEGQLAWISITARPIFRHGESKPYAAVGSFRDVTAERNRQLQLEFRVAHDDLTGLPNRDAFVTLLGQNRQAVFAVGYLDFNDFKSVNDRFGHAAGDDLLRQAAQRLKTQLRSGDVVARLSGDEFALYLPRIDSEQQAIKVKERIKTAFDAPFQLIGGFDVRIDTGLGIAFYPEDSDDLTQLMHLADLRMYESKALARRTPRAALP